MSDASTGERVVLLTLWVLPVLGSAALLWQAGVRVAAVGLVAVELLVGLLVVRARRGTARDRRSPGT